MIYVSVRLDVLHLKQSRKIEIVVAELFGCVRLDPEQLNGVLSGGAPSFQVVGLR